MKSIPFATVAILSLLFPLPAFSQDLEQSQQPYAWASGGICRTAVYRQDSVLAEGPCGDVRLSMTAESINVSYGFGDTRIVFITKPRAEISNLRRRLELPVVALATLRNGQISETDYAAGGWCESTDSDNRPSRRWISCLVYFSNGDNIHGIYTHPTDLPNDFQAVF